MGQPKTKTDITETQNRTDLLNNFISNYSFGRKIVDNMNQESKRYIKHFINDCVDIKGLSSDILELNELNLIDQFNNTDDVVIHFANKYNELEEYYYDLYGNWNIVRKKMISFNVEFYLKNNIPEYYRMGEKSQIFKLSSIISYNLSLCCIDYILQ